MYDILRTQIAARSIFCPGRHGLLVEGRTARLLGARRRKWWAGTGAKGRQRWIRAVDLRPMSG